jgi:uncharacterized OsmC-like protein/quercetin dioxygenase-like cupin family protein
VSRHIRLILALCLLLLALPLATAYGQAGSTPAPGAEEDGAQLVTASARANLVEPMRTIVHARGNHWVVDSVPPLGSPSEETNPLDMFLGALATCPVFVYETAAQELNIPLTRIEATVEGDFAPQGVRDGSVNPRIRAFRILIDMEGPTAEQAELLREQFELRCPIYTTLVRAAPIEVIHLGMDDVAQEVTVPVEMVQLILDFAPGAWTPLHSHGGPMIVTILEGEMTVISDQENGEETVYGPGEFWIETPGDTHVAGNNSDENARVAVLVLLPEGASLTTVVEGEASGELPPGPTPVSRTSMAVMIHGE